MPAGKTNESSQAATSRQRKDQPHCDAVVTAEAQTRDSASSREEVPNLLRYPDEHEPLPSKTVGGSGERAISKDTLEGVIQILGSTGDRISVCSSL
jgi:hypothetical protein